MKGLKVAAIIIIGLLIIFLVYKIVIKLKKPANANYVSGGGALPQGWTPDAIVEDLHHAILDVMVMTGTKDDAFKEFNELNDNQMIAVYNKWNDKYGSTTSFLTKVGTLTKAMERVWSYGNIAGANQRDIMMNNLKRLQLS